MFRFSQRRENGTPDLCFHLNDEMTKRSLSPHLWTQVFVFCAVFAVEAFARERTNSMPEKLTLLARLVNPLTQGAMKIVRGRQVEGAEGAGGLSAAEELDNGEVDWSMEVHVTGGGKL